jgi:hypothetical protein
MPTKYQDFSWKLSHNTSLFHSPKGNQFSSRNSGGKMFFSPVNRDAINTINRSYLDIML